MLPLQENLCTRVWWEKMLIEYFVDEYLVRIVDSFDPSQVSYDWHSSDSTSCGLKVVDIAVE